MSGSVGIEAARWRGTAAGHQLRILGKGCLGWREAVMVLLAPMTTARVLRDAEGCTPYDYARERDLATLLRQYVKRNYTKFGRAHPVSFMLGLEFYEGTWRVVLPDKYEPLPAPVLCAGAL